MDPATVTSVMNDLGWGVYVPIVLAAVGLVAHIAPGLPQASPNSPAWWRIARRIIDIVAGNYGHAANAAVLGAVPAKPPVAALLVLLAAAGGLSACGATAGQDAASAGALATAAPPIVAALPGVTPSRLAAAETASSMVASAAQAVAGAQPGTPAYQTSLTALLAALTTYESATAP